MDEGRPKVTDAPGIVWKRRKTEWVAIWQPRTDLVKRGYPSETVEIWRGVEPTERDEAYIADQCQSLQREMLIWGRGGIPATVVFDGRVSSLIDCYKTDPDSRFNKGIRYVSKVYYTSLMKRIERDCGEDLIRDLDARKLMRLHENWATVSGIPMAAALVGMVRTLATYGTILLKNADCKALKETMHDMRFEAAKPRKERLLAHHATAIIETAHDWGLYSIALAQAFQFECMFRQKDVIGEWVPLKEAGTSDVINQREQEKWLRGIRWSEIDSQLVLKHTTSKKGKDVEVDLRLAPMIVEELKFQYPGSITVDPVSQAVVIHRELLPASGPIIVSEYTGRPWYNYEFRRRWRQIAKASGVPDQVRNMDSRAGAISEARLSEASPDKIRLSATHSQLSQTDDYTRIQREAADNVLQMRAAYRNKK
jgi:hypothetical protein